MQFRLSKLVDIFDCKMSLVHVTFYLTVIFHSCVALAPNITHKQEMWVSGQQGEINTYRTPILITLPTGDLLAFSAPRKYTGSDKSAKFIVQRRSTNGGLDWGPTAVIEDDYDVEDGLNLGAVLVDYDTNVTFVMFGYCMHTTGPCQSKYRPRGVYYKISNDWGYSWTPAINVADKNPLLKKVGWAPGPGFGIQKRFAPNKGRLLACGHILEADVRRMHCIYSDDHGVTWYLNKPVYGLPYAASKITGDFTPGETQLIELHNGTILVTMRNEKFFHCRCRLQGLSFDGGMSFPVPYITIKDSLVDPAVFASLSLVNETLFLSHPSNAAQRINMTLHWSLDYGLTWPYALQLYEDSSEYSCLTKIDQNNLGILFERDGYKSIEFYKIKLNK